VQRVAHGIQTVVEEAAVPDIEVDIGSLIEHGSERALLEHVVRLLSDANRQAIVLCNIELGGRQIDCHCA
jgi:hypothetical protein